MFCLKYRQITTECDTCDFFICCKCDDLNCDMDCCDNCSYGTQKLKWRHWINDFWQRYILRKNNLLKPDELKDWFIYLWLWVKHDRKNKS